MSGFEVRRARPSEFPAITDLTLAAYLGGGFVDDDHFYVRDLQATEARATEAELWVAVDGSTVLVAVTYCPVGSPWRELAADDEGEFRMLAVSPEARGRGVGEALVRRCLDQAREAGLNGLAISTMSEMHDAHRLYEKLGFTRIPDEDWSPVSGICLMAFRLRF